MGIRGLLPGYMVGDHAPAQRHESEFRECPSCGGRMHRSASLCKACHYEHAAKGREVSKGRRRRFDAALALGWTLEDIYSFDSSEEYDPEKDKLPSWGEIIARDPGAYIRWWYKRGDFDNGGTLD